jgi:hypothetical protein
LLAGCYVAIGFDGSIVGGVLDIRQQPQSQTVTVGQSASFAVGVVGTGPLTFQWRRNGTDIPGASNAAYVTPPAALADSGSLFTVRVCNPSACVVSSPALLTVLPAG